MTAVLHVEKVYDSLHVSVRENEAVLGSVHVSSFGSVMSLFVSRVYRSQGYARMLMQEVVRLRGHITLYLEARPFGDCSSGPDMARLIAFYRKFGFRKSPTQPGTSGMRMYRCAHKPKD